MADNLGGVGVEMATHQPSMQSSPSERGFKNHNPFETDEWLENLAKPSEFSPQMFQVLDSPNCSVSGEKLFRWEVDELANLMPAHIEENAQQITHTHDSQKEARVQEAIDAFFSRDEILPSPWHEPPPPHVLPATPKYNAFKAGFQEECSCSDTAVQTEISLPVDFNLAELLAAWLPSLDICSRKQKKPDSAVFCSVKDDTRSSHDRSTVKDSFEDVTRKQFVSRGEISPPISPLCTPTSPLTPVSAHFSSSPIQKRGAMKLMSMRHGSNTNSPLDSPMISPILFSHGRRYERDFNEPRMGSFTLSPTAVMSHPPDFPPLSPISHLPASPVKEVHESQYQTMDSSHSLNMFGASNKSAQDTGYQTGYNQQDNSSQLSEVGELNQMKRSKRLSNDEVFSRLHCMTRSNSQPNKVSSGSACEVAEAHSLCIFPPPEEAIEFGASGDNASCTSDLGFGFLSSRPRPRFLNKNIGSAFYLPRKKSSEKSGVYYSEVVSQTLDKAKKDLKSYSHKP